MCSLWAVSPWVQQRFICPLDTSSSKVGFQEWNPVPTLTLGQSLWKEPAESRALNAASGQLLLCILALGTPVENTAFVSSPLSPQQLAGLSPWWLEKMKFPWADLGTGPNGLSWTPLLETWTSPQILGWGSRGWLWYTANSVTSYTQCNKGLDLWVIGVIPKTETCLCREAQLKTWLKEFFCDFFFHYQLSLPTSLLIM